MNQSRRRTAGIVFTVTLVIFVVCWQGQRGASQPAPDPVVPTTRPVRTQELLEAMQRLVGLSAQASYVQSWVQRIDAGQASIDGFIDEILSTDRFGSEVVPSLVFGSYVNVRNYYALPSGFVLRQTPEGVYYLREPCLAGASVTVTPWWNLRTEVRVCPDSYRPEVWTVSPNANSYVTKTTMACDSQIGSPELETSSVCGCGPKLIRCVRDTDQFEQLKSSLIDEVKRTVAYVVQHDLPIATLFTGNSTFRNRDAELYYRRQKIGALHDVDAADLDLETWPQDGQWAPRPELLPGQHAGLLTSPQILHALPDRRQRQRAYYELMWCNLRNAFGATTHKVLEINTTGNNSFEHDSWQRLAHTPLCTTCHARLDYGFQFFLGYPDSRGSTHYIQSDQRTGEGPLYGRDIDDLRGTAPLTPLGFAKLATVQPEFDDCMATNFASYVLGDQATTSDLSAIDAALKQHGTFKTALKVGLERYAARWGKIAPTTSQVVETSSGLPGSVVVSSTLRATLDRYCSDCHDSSQPAFADSPDRDDVATNFTPPILPRPLVIGMLDKVAFGAMPVNNPLDPAVREEVVLQLVNTLWSDGDSRDQSLRYYLTQARGLPAQQIDNAFYFINTLAGSSSGLKWGPLERSLWSDQNTMTPGFIATVSLEALAACEQATKVRAGGLEDCLGWTTAIPMLARDPNR